MTDESESLAEETGPRFEIWTMDGGMVAVMDTDAHTPRPVLTVPLADSLRAEERAATWNRRHELGIEDVFAEPLTPYGTKPATPTVTAAGCGPAVFLAETLPAYASAQHTLSEVDEVMDRAIREIRTYSEILARASALREKLTARLTALASTQAAENGSLVPLPAPDLWERVRAVIRDQYERQHDLFKPGPF